jgi:hypothetical protein
MLTQPGTERYDFYWGPTFLFEGLGSVVMLVMMIPALALLIRKRFTFPGFMMALLGLNLMYHGIDHVLVSQITSLAQLGPATFAQRMLSMLLGCAIWSSYFFSSKRVKATFRH